MLNFKQKIEEVLEKNGILEEDFEFSKPPENTNSDISIPLFKLMKKTGKKPPEILEFLKPILENLDFLEKIEVLGPYLNLTLKTKSIFEEIFKIKNLKRENKNPKLFLVEFGCPNPMKVFHIGHLKNLITGESVARILEAGGDIVKRVNYQGDVGMHIGKTMYGILNNLGEWKEIKTKKLEEKIKFLGRVYAESSKKFEENDEEKKKIEKVNTEIYDKKAELMEIYNDARNYSLEYFETIYEKLGAKYDKYYFESEMYENAKKITENQIFELSEGAKIFRGSNYGLHDRVFLNSLGYPTYEAKDLALAEKHFEDFPNLEKIIHVVGKEQTEYFEVVFKAMEEILPISKRREYHFVGGYLQLKGQKMSSRLGNVVAGDELIKIVEDAVKEKTENSEVEYSKIALGALKYSMLKGDVHEDIAFDLEESISTVGESGPYILYSLTRVKSILRKVEKVEEISEISENFGEFDRKIMIKILEFFEVFENAYIELKPHLISKYLFTLSQEFSRFYENASVMNEKDEKLQKNRIKILNVLELILGNGLNLLGIESVEKM
jgi:arginyl-tRNA synthetase